MEPSWYRLDRNPWERARGLDDREQAILASHSGLAAPLRSLDEIGSALGVTAERVRQIEKGGLEKLRAAAAAPPG